jgi:hypothetical protein
MGIGIDPIVPIGKQPSQVVCPIGLHEPELFVNTKKNFCQMRPLDPSIYLEENPGILMIYNNTHFVSIN